MHMHSLIAYNISWMAFNLELAFLPLLFASLFFRFDNKFLKTVFFVAWLAFLPNSAYVMTDMLHLIDDWGRIMPDDRFLIICQYIVFEILGLAAFVFALYPFEKALRKSWAKKSASDIILAMNFIIGFGMVLGRVDRVNSWQVITAPHEVASAALHVLTSLDLMFLVVLFGLFNNIFYFLFHNTIKPFFRKLMLKQSTTRSIAKR
jgi:uncharacterized membrane protein